MGYLRRSLVPKVIAVPHSLLGSLGRLGSPDLTPHVGGGVVLLRKHLDGGLVPEVVAVLHRTLGGLGRLRGTDLLPHVAGLLLLREHLDGGLVPKVVVLLHDPLGLGGGVLGANLAPHGRSGRLDAVVLSEHLDGSLLASSLEGAGPLGFGLGHEADLLVEGARLLPVVVVLLVEHGGPRLGALPRSVKLTDKSLVGPKRAGGLGVARRTVAGREARGLQQLGGPRLYARALPIALSDEADVGAKAMAVEDGDGVGTLWLLVEQHSGPVAGDLRSE